MLWWQSFILLMCLVLMLFSTNIPVAFAFGVVNVLSLIYLFKGTEVLSQVVLSAYSTVSSFTFVAIPLFLLMGNILNHTEFVNVIISDIEKIVGKRVPLSGCYITVFAGAIVGALMGASIACTAMLGAALIPILNERRYPKRLILGTILGGGTLDNLIPPSVGMVLIGSLTGISVGGLLVGGIGPGLLILGLFCVYIYLLSLKYRKEMILETEEKVSFTERVRTLLSMLPLLFPMFMATGVIYMGIATPSEAAATGVLSLFIVVILYKRLTWKNFKMIILDTAEVSAMLLLIVSAATVYSQILSITGITKDVTAALISLELSTSLLVGLIIFIALFLGCLINQTSIIFITAPIVSFLLKSSSIDPVWFGELYAMAIGLGAITPPFGMSLFVLRGVCSKIPSFEADMGEIFKSAIPFILIEILAIIIVMIVPSIVPHIDY